MTFFMAAASSLTWGIADCSVLGPFPSGDMGRSLEASAYPRFRGVHSCGIAVGRHRSIEALVRIGRALGVTRRFNRGGMVGVLCAVRIDDAELHGELPFSEPSRIAWHIHDSSVHYF